MNNAFTSGSNGFKPFKRSEQARVTTDTAFKKSGAWNQSTTTPADALERKMAATLRASQIDAMNRQTHGR